MSSPEELTFVVGRWLRPIVAVLHLVRWLKAVATSSREQMSISDSGAIRSDLVHVVNGRYGARCNSRQPLTSLKQRWFV